MKRQLLLTGALILTCGIHTAFAQRMEVGGGLTLHQLSKSESTVTGFSGRFTFDITKWLAAEAEVTFFPNDDIPVPVGDPPPIGGNFRLVYERRRTDGLFGAKIGYRGSHYGVFAKVRPGFTRLTDKGLACTGADCASILALSLPFSYRTEFALDFGGGFEAFPSRQTVVRFEFGDTMIRHTSEAPPCWQNTCTSDNFTFRVGGGVRF